MIIGGAMDYPPSSVPTLFNPPIGGSWAIGISVETIKQNWNDLDTVNIMSYANDVNLDPI